MAQPTLFDQQPTGRELALIGMANAIAKADKDCPKWSEQAKDKLRQFLAVVSGAFQTEDFRKWAEANGLPQPENKRSYGGIILGAANENLIRKLGTSPVDNPKAHGANAGVWVKV